MQRDADDFYDKWEEHNLIQKRLDDLNRGYERIANDMYYRVKRNLLRNEKLMKKFEDEDLTGPEIEAACMEEMRRAARMYIGAQALKAVGITLLTIAGLSLAIQGIRGGAVAIKALWAIVDLSTGR